MIRYFFFTCLVLALSFSNVHAYETENKLIAVIIGKVSKFVTWKTSDNTTFNITILNNPFGSLLETIYKNKKIKNKSVEVNYIENIEQLSDNTQVLYIANVSHVQLALILKAVAGKNILTISDSRGFAEREGIIQISFISQKVKLKINRKISQQENLTISSSLLKIAKLVG